MGVSKDHGESEHRLPQAVPLPQTQPSQAASAGTAPYASLASSASPNSAIPADTQSAAAQQPSEEPAEEQEQNAAIALLVENSSPWLLSMIFHMTVMIVMGLVFYVNMPRKPLELNAEMIYAEKKGDQLLFDAPGLPDVQTTVDEFDYTPEELSPVSDPLALPPQKVDMVRTEGTTAVSDSATIHVGNALSGRKEGSSTKKGLLGKYGGTETTETAVQRGLEWLARNQRRDGSWSLAGPYNGGVSRELDNEAAATAMALLAFQGAGNTHQGGTYKKNVTDAWRWLLKQQDKQGCFFQQGGFNHRFYTQGQCTIAICELYGMTKDTIYRDPAQRAIDYCLRCQSSNGGWRYTPNSDSDTSVTGWIVMAMQSAKMAGLDVPQENLRQVTAYLDEIAQYDGSRYPYQRNGDVRLSMTAEALLMREYLGWKQNDPRLIAGMEWITSKQNLVNFQNNRNVYYWYYATQAARHIGGEYWNRWNKVMRQALPEQQVSKGREAGSWDPNRPTTDQWAAHGGRLYVTCLSIYMLEVYYRYMPIYSSVYTYDASPLAPVEDAAAKSAKQEKADAPKDETDAKPSAEDAEPY